MDSNQQKLTADYIIVGQGLAGSCLALQLIYLGKSVIVFDQPGLNKSSAIAAGLFNPVTGKMMTKSWRANIFFPYLHQFYPKAEKFLGKSFFHPLPLYRPFISIEEQNEWMGLSTVASMKPYILKIFHGSQFGNEVNDPFGGVLIDQAGYVDVRTFLDCIRQYLESSGSYCDEKLEDRELVVDPGGVSYRNMKARKIIFCGGVSDLTSRYFSTLPIRPLKGETLEISMEPVGRIYNRGVFVAPGQQARQYRVGATYDFNLSPCTTEAGRTELEGKLRDLMRIPFRVDSQNWGIRPTTPDRRVMLGTHPSHPNLVVFNGLGTKGVSLAPYYSGQLTEWLLGTGEIAREVNIQRFKSLYFEV